MILASIGVFLVVVLLLVVILLVAKNFLVPSGNVKLTINGEKELDVASGSTLLNTLSVMVCSFPPLVVVKVPADSANARWWKVEAKSCLLRLRTSAVSKYKTTGVWVAR